MSGTTTAPPACTEGAAQPTPNADTIPAATHEVKGLVPVTIYKHTDWCLGCNARKVCSVDVDPRKCEAMEMTIRLLGYWRNTERLQEAADAKRDRREDR